MNVPSQNTQDLPGDRPAVNSPTARAAAEHWAADLAAWRIPDQILAGAPRSPWIHPVALFDTEDGPIPDSPHTPSPASGWTSAAASWMSGAAAGEPPSPSRHRRPP